jgi:hypothetical protein
VSYAGGELPSRKVDDRRSLLAIRWRRHSERPLDNHALEKSVQDGAQGPKSCSEMAPLEVGFERECAGKPGLSREALTVEKS